MNETNNKIVALAKVLLSDPQTEDGSMVVNTEIGSTRLWTCIHCKTEITEKLSGQTLVDDGKCKAQLEQHPDSCKWKQFIELTPQ